jgi:uncharacterized protein YkwD
MAMETAEAQTYYYYPSSVASGWVDATGATYTPSYYWSPGYQVQGAWTSYPSQYYQATYTPQYYQTAYTQTYAQTDYTYQNVQSAHASQVIQASYTTEVQSATAPPTGSGDPYGFTAWLNATRAAYGLSAVGYDPNLESWAAVNNSHQTSYGIGHFVMGSARVQNSAMGGFPGIESMWMSSPAHRAALLDPTIRWIGIAGLGAYWTFNVRRGI